jgi:hypothetical protein
MSARTRLGLLLTLLVVALVATSFRFRHRAYGPRLSPEFMTNALETLQAYEDREAQKYWGPELIAEKYGRAIEELWDNLNASSNKLFTLATAGVQSVMLGKYGDVIHLPQAIELMNPMDAKAPLAADQWSAFLQTIRVAGWELAQCEFRHVGFTNSSPPSSRFYFSAHLENAKQQRRAILEGDLVIHWDGSPEAPRIGMIDASKVQIQSRTGAVPFRLVMDEEVAPKDGSYFIDPLIVWDLDGDGTSEIILAAANRAYRRQPDGTWTHSPLCEVDPGLIFTGALGDFTGNGTVDFLCAKFEGLFLYEGTKDGRFPDPPRQVWTAQPHLKYAQTLAIGDIDGDGDLDLFLGQYKVPYEKGQMPRPYFDANDGNASYLLENDGKGNFSDITLRAGLGAKRGRRVYNASFIDLDHDGMLDLLLVSDFAGLDVFRNEGSGRFKDVTTNWFTAREGFGMANCFADFNRDGRLDILMIGMNSPTAERLSSLGLARPYDLPDAGLRSRVTFGNRLLFGQADGTFRQTAMSEQIARTGWSWGCVAEDFDNDGFPDLYIANGHESRGTVRDYEPEFWLHDIYVGDSSENALAQTYFREKMSHTRGRGWSYGGYEKNRFFLNLAGTNFLECAYLIGLALESDSRNVVARDLDGDGRADLILTTFELFPKVRQTVKVFRNELPVETRYSTVTFRDLATSGRVVSLDNRVEPLLSTSSFRSQVQPALRGLSAELSNVVSRLQPKSDSIRVQSPK